MSGQRTRYLQYDKVFREYVVQQYPGQGGFGEVYQVVNTIVLPFALKVLHGDVTLEQRGAEAVMQIQSTRLVRIHDFGEARNGEGCILMEYVRDTLESVMVD